MGRAHAHDEVWFHTRVPFMSADSLIPYDDIVQEALRAVIGQVLAPVVDHGLPGNHHFYITLKTQYPGVRIPSWLLAKYPDEITIVIQHRFWGLAVYENFFEVGLSFNQKPELLRVPFAAVTSFVDPEVNFVLQFQAQNADQDIEPLLVAQGDPLPDAMQDPAHSAEEADEQTPASDNVVSIDRFRKK